MIGISTERMQHSLAVARKMKKMAESTIPPLTKDKCEEMFILGYLHDVGYEFTAIQEDHAKVGGEVLNRQGFKYWKEVYCHGDPNTEYSSDALTLLNIADLTIDENGNEVDVKDRLNGIAKKYGKDSKQFVDAEKLAEKIGLISDVNIKLNGGLISEKMSEILNKPLF